MNELLNRLNHRNVYVREEAIAEARKLTPEQLLTLISLEKSLPRQGRTNFLRRSLWLHVPVFLAYLWNPTFFGPGFLFGYAGVFVFWYFYLVWPTYALLSLIRVIDAVEDPRYVAPVLALLAENRQNSEVRESVTIALKRLLPEFHDDQAEGLTLAQYNALLLDLTTPYENPELSVCLLKVFEQIGNESAVWVVSQIAGHRHPNARKRPVMEAAQRCLEAIQYRIAQAKEAQTLLRPSSALDTASSKTLLRPATSTAGTAPEELLRAGKRTNGR